MAKKREQEQVKQEPAAEKLTRQECAQRVVGEIDGDCTLDELAEQADKLYLAGHPNAEPDTDEAARYVQWQLESLEGLGLVELTWHCSIHPNIKMPNARNGSNGNGR